MKARQLAPPLMKKLCIAYHSRTGNLRILKGFRNDSSSHFGFRPPEGGTRALPRNAFATYVVPALAGEASANPRASDCATPRRLKAGLHARSPAKVTTPTGLRFERPGSRRNPVGVETLSTPISQGSSCLSTPGFVTESLQDSARKTHGTCGHFTGWRRTMDNLKTIGTQKQ